VKTVGRELGVRYLLGGSVRKAGNRVRVTGQLIEAETGGHLWAERYDRDLTDIFAVQDEITASVSAAILPTMERSERERAARKPPENLDAWECYHRGMWHLATIDATEIEKAQSFFRRAIELYPQFAPPTPLSPMLAVSTQYFFGPNCGRKITDARLTTRGTLSLSTRRVQEDMSPYLTRCSTLDGMRKVSRRRTWQSASRARILRLAACT
jgi:hypothetical protein